MREEKWSDYLRTGNILVGQCNKLSDVGQQIIDTTETLFEPVLNMIVYMFA